MQRAYMSFTTTTTTKLSEIVFVFYRYENSWKNDKATVNIKPIFIATCFCFKFKKLQICNLNNEKLVETN